MNTNNYDFIDNKIRNIKVLAFDAIANIGIDKEEIENISTQRTDSISQQQLEEIWGLLNNAEKFFLNGGNLYAEAMIKASNLKIIENQVINEETNTIEENNNQPKEEIINRQEEVKEENKEELDNKKTKNENEALMQKDAIIERKEPIIQITKDSEMMKDEENNNTKSSEETPVIKEENETDQNDETIETPLLQVFSSEDNEEEQKENVLEPIIEEKPIFQKTSNLQDKAILINTEQARKIRESKEVQSSLFNSIDSLPSNEIKQNEISQEKQVEEMLNKVTELYEQGNTKEAEAMSERISEINKKLVENEK